MLNRDYIPESVYGFYGSINKHPIFETACYGLLSSEINLSEVYLLLNVQDIKTLPRLPKIIKKCLISFHTEFYKINDLLDFFNKNSSVDFLLLSDGAQHSNIWPQNVSYCRWISWGDQIEKSKSLYGVQKKYKNKNLKISSLSFRTTLHRAVITGYVLANYPHEEIKISWFGMYNTALDYDALPTNLKQWTKFIPAHQVSIDKFDVSDNFPLLNGNWHNLAHTDCVFNLTNESIFDNYCSDDQLVTVPYLTEKTWKPLLAGQALIPVGHSNTVSSLSQLGLKFDYDLDFTFDSTLQDFDRLEQIIKIIQEINETSVEQLNLIVKDSVQHNLDLLNSKEFLKNCIDLNIKELDNIAQWTNQ